MKASHWLASLALVPLCGCATTVRYEPDVPRIERGTHAQGTIVALSLGEQGLGTKPPPLSVELDVELPETHGVAGAFLSSTYVEGCVGQSDALQVIAEPPGARPGRYRQRLRFVASDLGLELMGPTTLDLLVMPIRSGTGPSECLRLPLSTGDERYSMHHESGGEWVFSTATRFEVVIGSTTMSAINVFPIGIGRMLGPLRLTLAAGLAEAYCAEALCGETDTGDIFTGPMLPLELEAEAFFMSTPAHTLALALRPAIGVAYFDESLAQKQRVVLRPGVAFKWLLTYRTAAYPGLPSTPRGATVGFELPIGVFHDPADGFETGWFIGLGLSLAAAK